MKHLALVVLLAAACSEESINPAPRPSASVPGPPDAGGEGGASPTEPRVRDVYTRNPFGAPFDNLMADGDFELSIVREGNTGQYGWIAFSQVGDASILSETGGLCRSGLLCGRARKGTVLFGRGTAAAGLVPHRASIWIKGVPGSEPKPDEPCNIAEAYVLECDTFQSQQALDPAAAPDEHGWCQFSQEVKKASVALCMYIEVGDEDVLVDNATLLAAPDLATSPAPPAIPPPAESSERMLRIRDRIRSRMPFGNPPPDVAGRPD